MHINSRLISLRCYCYSQWYWASQNDFHFRTSLDRCFWLLGPHQQRVVLKLTNRPIKNSSPRMSWKTNRSDHPDDMRVKITTKQKINYSYLLEVFRFHEQQIAQRMQGVEQARDQRGLKGFDAFHILVHITDHTHGTARVVGELKKMFVDNSVKPKGEKEGGSLK